MEIILVDDGSTDASGNICDEYVIKDSRIKVIHKQNGGVCAARNTGLDLAQGNYIAFVDPDDYILPDMYRTLLTCINKINADFAICQQQDIDINGSVLSTTHFINKDFTYNRYDKWFEDFVIHAAAAVVWNKLFTRHSIGNHRFDTNLVRAEDLNFILDITQTHHRISAYPQVFYYYVKRPNSAVRQKKIKNFEDEYIVWMRIWKKAIELSTHNSHLNWITQHIYQKEIITKAYKLAVLIILLDKKHIYDTRLEELKLLFREQLSKRNLLSNHALRIWIYIFGKYPKLTIWALRFPIIRQLIYWYITKR